MKVDVCDLGKDLLLYTRAQLSNKLILYQISEYKLCWGNDVFWECFSFLCCILILTKKKKGNSKCDLVWLNLLLMDFIQIRWWWRGTNDDTMGTGRLIQYVGQKYNINKYMQQLFFINSFKQTCLIENESIFINAMGGHGKNSYICL